MAVHADPSRAASPSPLLSPPVPAPMGAPSRGRRPALDGVRGIAVALVVMHHFTQGFAHRPEGGFLGVDLFFVLSGYLITGVLVRSRLRTGRIELSRFWLRRARRLLPPLLLVLVLLTWLVHAAASPQKRPYLRDDALSTLFYTANLHTVAGLDAWGNSLHANLLLHTWSLAVEEQFYLAWPLLLAGLLALGSRVGRPARPALWTCAALGAASFGWLAAGYLAGAAPSAYFDTRGRAGELLAGAALALALPRVSRSASSRLGDRAGRLWGALAAVGLLGVLAAVGTLDQARPAYYLGGALAVTLAVSALVAAVEASPGGMVARALGSAPLVALGWISYTLYLVQFPMIAMIPLPHPLTFGAVLAVETVRLTFALGFATLSSLLLERPLLAGTLPWVGRSRPRLALAGIVTTLATAVAVIAWTSLPGDLDSQVRADPVVACPGQTQHSFTTCPLSSASGGTDSWVVTGDGNAAGLAGALSTVPGVGVTQAAWSACGAGGLTAAPEWPDASPVPVSPAVLCARDTPGLVAEVLAKPGTSRLLVADATSALVPLTAGGVRALPGTAAHDDRVRAALLQLVDEAAARGVRTVLLRQPPPSADLATVVAPGSPAAATPPDAEMTRWLRRYDDVLTAVAAARPAWAGVVSVDDLVCPGGSSPGGHRRAARAPRHGNVRPRLRPPARARAGSASAERAHASTTSGMIIGRRR